MSSRPGWDAYFLALAETVATRADCQRAQVGAVIVANRRIISTGYNGTPAGDQRSCLAGDCPRAIEGPQNDAEYTKCINLHAEQNAIAYADGGQCRGATIYVTKSPCSMCSKLIAAAGIVMVVCLNV